MLSIFFVYLSNKFEFLSFLNVFGYLTVQTILAVFTAFFISVLIGDKLILVLQDMQGKGQPIRDDGPEQHFFKRGTPTMGGVLIFISLIVGSLSWINIYEPIIWMPIIIAMSFGFIGFIDDYKKVSKQQTDGLSGKIRLSLEFIISVIIVFWLQTILPKEISTTLTIPGFKNLTLDLGIFYIPFGAMVIVGAGNAVNLTDGLDGLAIVPVAIVASVLGAIGYLAGHSVLAQYLLIDYIPGAGNMAVLCGAIIGAAMGFLWFNAPPAKIFMGDTGSLALGGVLGTISLIIKHELVFAIAGGIFVIEALSVIIQVISYKLYKKRVFLMAPIHHHFEKKGWAESTVVIRFWIISIILALFALSTLKLR